MSKSAISAYLAEIGRKGGQKRGTNPHRSELARLDKQPDEDTISTEQMDRIERENPPSTRNLEVELLRTELERVKQQRDNAQTHAERLAEALRDWLNAPNDYHSQQFARMELQAWDKAKGGQ